MNPIADGLDEIRQTPLSEVRRLATWVSRNGAALAASGLRPAD